MANPNFNCTLNAWVSGNTIYANFTYSRSGSYSYYDITLPTPTMTIAGETFYDNDFANRVHSGVTVGSITSSTFSKSVGNGTYGVTWNCGSGQRSDFAGSWSTSVVVNTGTGPSSIAIKFNSASWNSVNTTTTIGSWGTGYTGTPNLENVVVDGNATAANWETMGRQGRQHATEATSVTDSVTNANSVSYSGGFVIKGCSKYKIAGYASTSVGNVKMIDADNVRYTPPYELTSLSYTSQSATTNGDVAVVLSAVTNSANNTSGRTIGFQARSGIVGKNLFDKDEVLPMCYLDSTGAMNSTDLWVVTPLIPVDAGEQYTYSGLHNVGVSPYSAYYAADGTIVSTFKQATGSNTITIPAGASYVRFSILNGNGVFDKNTFQIEEGTSATAYEAYSLTGEHSGWVDLPTTCSVGQTATLTVTCSKEQYSKIEVRQFTVEDQTDEVQYSTVSSTMVQTISTIKLYGPVGDAATGSGTTFSINNTSDAGITVNNLKGNTTQQTYTGKNLIGEWTSQGVNKGLTIVVNSDGSLSASGQAETTYSTLTVSKQFLEPVPNGTKLTFSIKSNAPVIFGIILTNTGGANRQDVNIPAGSRSVTVTTNSQKVNYWIWVQGLTAGNNYDFTIEDIMLEVGDSPTSYEPYVGGIASPNPDYPQNVNVVTGLQVITISDGGSQSVTKTVNLGGEEFDKTKVTSGYCLDQSGSLIADPYNGWCLTDYMPVESGRDYVYTGITVAGVVPYSAYYDSAKNLVSTFKQATGSNTITIPSGVSYVRFSLRNFEPNVDKNTFSFKLDGVDIELCKIGNYQDYIYKSGDDWYVHKDIGKYIADGDTEWTKSQYGTNNYSCIPSPAILDGALGSVSNTILIKSDCFIGVSFNNRVLEKDNITYSTAVGSDKLLFVRNIAYNTVTDLTTFCANNKPVFYYALSTPTDTQITESHLIEQLNNLARAYTYKGSTAFSVSGNLPGVLSVSAITDANTKSKRIMKLYGSVDGKSVEIVKLYGSVNGKTKRIF